MLVTRASPDVTQEPHEHEGKLGTHLKILKAPKVLLPLKCASFLGVSRPQFIASFVSYF